MGARAGGRKDRGAGTAPPRAAGPPPLPPQLGAKAKFWLTLGPRTLFGDGKAELLEGVDKLGSLRAAAARMSMSYRHAWGLVRELDEAAGFRFLEHGGGPRSPLQLTREGRLFLAAYRRFREPLAEEVERCFARAFPRSRRRTPSRRGG